MSKAETAKEPPGQGLNNDTAKLIFCVVGVVGSLLVYGVLQERIMTIPYGEKENAEVFKYSLFLVCCNRMVAATIAACTLLVKGDYKELRPVAPIWSYASVSLSNVVATTCQYEALRHVTFAVQTLGKCAKMFPVMVWGYIMLKKRYTLKEMLLAVCITSGCFVFFMTGETTSRVAKAGSNASVYGVLLMVGYLTADGYTSTCQQQMFKGYQMTSYNQVMYTSLCSIVLSSFGLLTSGQVPATFGFLMRHPVAIWNITLLSCAASSGSLFISYTIKSFGALVFAIIMTTRQFLSILLSSIFFGNPLTMGQWMGTVIVVSSLYYQSVSKGGGHEKKAASATQGPRRVSLTGTGQQPHGGPGSDEEHVSEGRPLLSTQN